MGDRAYTTLLAWPYRGREEPPAGLIEQLEHYDFLPDSDTPLAGALLGGECEGAVVLAGDAQSGRILACVDEQANYGTAAYSDLIAELTAAGLHVYAGNEAGDAYGAGSEYHPAGGAARERRRCDSGDMSLIAMDLLSGGEKKLSEVPDAELAARTRVLLSAPSALPPAVAAAGGCCC